MNFTHFRQDLLASVVVFLVAYYFAAVRGCFSGPKKLMTEQELLKMEQDLQKTSAY